MDSQNKHQCPICGNYFVQNVINKHANSCLFAQESKSKNMVPSDQPVKDDISFAPPKKKTKFTDGFEKDEFTVSVTVPANPRPDTATGSLLEMNTSTDCIGIDPSTFSINDTSAPKKQMFASIFQPKASDKKSQENRSTKSKSKNSSESVNSDPLNKIKTDSPADPCFKLEVLPLPEFMRPSNLDNFFGQEHIIGENKLLRKLLDATQIPSIILWGPPGCGKTTLAKIIAKKAKDESNSRFVQLSATVAGISDVKHVINVAANELKMFKKKTVLFIDEIHRFNKLQQDTFLPHVENGTIILIGATTENPSFQVNNALLSRCRVIVLEKLDSASIRKIIQRALNTLRIKLVKEFDNKSCASGIFIEEDAVDVITQYCDGDARNALNALQLVHKSCTDSLITITHVKEALLRTHIQYDRAGDEHYQCASALQKSIRGSDANAAIYWMTRMWEGGEDPLFIARRLVVTASEDIGLADPQALPLAIATFQACHFIGRPECGINLAHCTTYLSKAPKSNETYMAFKSAQTCIKDNQGPLPGVPLHLRNATSSLTRQLGFGKGYKYSHDSTAKQDFLPPELYGTNFFMK